MRILLIGGNGFIGSHLVDMFLEKGHTVRVFDSRHEMYRLPKSEVDYRFFDLNDRNELRNSLREIDIVFHLASASVPNNSNERTIYEIEKILVPTITLLKDIAESKIKKFVYFSSGGAVYGPNDQSLVSEDIQLQPISSYGILKVAIESYIKMYAKNCGFNFIILRPSNPYGPRQNHKVVQGVISTFLRKIASGEEITIFGNTSITKDYIYISDLAECCYRIAMSDENGIFNVGSGVGHSLQEVIDICRIATGVDFAVKQSSNQSSDIDRFILDISKLKKHINWEPQIDIYKGVICTWNWIKENKSKFQ